MEKISSILIIACLLTSLYSAINVKALRFLWAFPVYFLVVIIIQEWGNYLAHHQKSNVVLYNTFSTLEFSFYFFVLRSIVHSKILKKILFFLIVVFPLFSFLNIFLFQGTSVFHTLTYSIGCILITIFCIFYFVELFQMPKAIDLMKSPPFWICTAILFSYICTFPFWGMTNMMTLSFSNFQKALTMLNIINILSYILFLIAFLCRIKIRRSIS